VRKKIDKADLGYEEEIEENGFIEAASGTPIASFDFSQDTPTTQLTDNRRFKPLPNVPTPSISGEGFNIKRTYKIRESSARMLNEIKAAHPDVNVYMNTIVDAAIRHYYDFIFAKSL
jgi:hypothetical protein